MPVPIVYRSGGDLNATYSWTDIVSMTGYRRFYACRATDTVSIKTFISERILDSEPVYTNGSSASAGYVVVTDLDFDIIFKKSATIRGMGLINYMLEPIEANQNVYTVATVYHVRGGTETSIGTVQSKTESSEGWKRHCLTMTLTTKQFAKEDILRLNMVVYQLANGATKNVRLYHDPSSRVTNATGGTDLIFDCPFKIDI